MNRTSTTQKMLVVTVIMLSIQGCDSGSGNASRGTKSPSALAEPKGSQKCLPETIVTPYLDRELTAGKSLVWCATFQIAWDRLRDSCGGTVRTIPMRPTVRKLNREPVSEHSLPENGVISASGLVSEGIFEEIERQMKRIPGATGPHLLPTRDMLNDNSFIFYAYLQRSLRYPTPFSSVPAISFGGRGDVVSFGIEDYSPVSETMRTQGNQIRILWHRFEASPSSERKQQFIVELLSSDKADRLILASLVPSPTLGETIDHFMELIKHPNTKQAVDVVAPEVSQLLSVVGEGGQDKVEQKLLASISAYSSLLLDEDLRIPEIRVDVVRSFTDLVGLRIVCDSEQMRDKPIIDARQKIRFALDDRGADLESEAVGVAFGDAGLRNFCFCDPFLVMLIRNNAERPYFAMWVANDEVLVPTK